MCGRFTNTVGPDELTRQIGQQFSVQFREAIKTDPWDIRPTEQVAAIVESEGVAEGRMLRWSLLPWWATDLKATRQPLINARLEGLVEKGAYANIPIDQLHRGLILADGFYEWQHPEDKKLKGQPYRFTVEEGRVFAFAGLWTTNNKIEGGPIHSCTIVTCDFAANPLVSNVHHRMPAILTEDEDMWAWMSPDVPTHDALSLCRALGADRMSVEARQPGSEDAPEQLTLQ